MNDYTNPEIQEEELLEDEELSFSDKAVGVFTEPIATFESIAKYDLKFIDWFLPILIVAILAISSQFLLMINPEIKHEIIKKQMTAIEERIDEAVESGQMSQAQGEQQLEIIQSRMGDTNPVFMLIQGGIGLVMFFIVFFIIAAFYFILAKFILKGEGSYTGAMIASALPSFITLLQLILIIIVSLVMGKLIKGFSIATLLGMGNDTLVGFILSRFEVFSIFAYSVTGIALAKLFKAESVKNYIIAVIASWLVASTIIWVLSQSFSFLENFI